MTEIQATACLYAQARRDAGLKPLSYKRIREIAKAKIALAKELGKKRRNSADIAIIRRVSPTRARGREALVSAISVEDQLAERLWSPGCSAFWLDPDRWHGVPMGADGRLEPFWLHLDKGAAADARP